MPTCHPFLTRRVVIRGPAPPWHSGAILGGVLRSPNLPYGQSAIVAHAPPGARREGGFWGVPDGGLPGASGGRPGEPGNRGVGLPSGCPRAKAGTGLESTIGGDPVGCPKGQGFKAPRAARSTLAGAPPGPDQAVGRTGAGTCSAGGDHGGGGVGSHRNATGRFCLTPRFGLTSFGGGGGGVLIRLTGTTVKSPRA